MKSFNQDIKAQELSQYGCTLTIKRDDVLHPEISGNKFRKLKYILLDAREKGATQLLTFGGAFSNHIAATAAAGKLHGFKTIGIIRGQELKNSNNPTLYYAKSCGMALHFIDRAQYKLKNTAEFTATLKDKFGEFYSIPEGGTNALAIKGCEEILEESDSIFDYICVPVGTGGTITGIINTVQTHQKVLGFSALKGDFLNAEVSKLTSKEQWEITDQYCFGGYAKINLELISFINQFSENHNIQLDPVYTGKMIFGIFDLIKQGWFKKNSRILAIHTGGLQGIAGMNEKLLKKNLPIINVI